MKKILYIVPILVFAMVGLTQDAKAQNGQTGNASNAITQAASNTVATNALVATSNNSQGGGNTNNNSVITLTLPPPPQVPSSIKISLNTTNVAVTEINQSIKLAIATALNISTSRVSITNISAG